MQTRSGISGSAVLCLQRLDGTVGGSNAPMGAIRDVVMAHTDDIKALLHQRHAVSIKVFGSVARGEDHAGSDVDLLVDFGPGASILDQVHLEAELRALLHCDVDVVPVGGLKPRDGHTLAEAVALCVAVLTSAAQGTVSDDILLRADGWLLEIIGEAATTCSPAFKAHLPGIDWEGIAGIRIVLARHYHRTQQSHGHGRRHHG